MQSWTHAPYLAESAAEPLPWGQAATHLFVSLTFETGKSVSVCVSMDSKNVEIPSKIFEGCQWIEGSGDL